MPEKSYGKNSAYDVEIIGDNVYRIHEFGAANCYLIVGNREALLIDTGNGMGDLKKIVESLTDLPISVVATHAHPDHIGGMGNFPAIHIHKKDSKHVKFWAAKALRKFYYDTVRNLIKYDITKKDIKKLKYRTKVIPVEEGHRFDLGGKTVNIIHTPGHTTGSIVLLLKEDKLMFTGDNVNPTLLHIVPGSTTIEDWLLGAKRILALTDEYKVYNGHDDGIGTKKQIAELVSLGEKLLEKYSDGNGSGGVKYYPGKKNRPRIIYWPNRVKNKSTEQRK